MPLVNNPLAFRPMDVLHCGDAQGERPIVRLFHRFTRMFTAGFEDRGNKSVAVHTAIVFPLRKQLVVVEMIGTDGGLRISSLERTCDGKPRNVIAASRYEIYDNEETRNIALDRIAFDIRKTVEYDPKGCLEFAFKRIKDDPTRRICSEYFYINAKEDGQRFPSRFALRVSPWDLQSFKEIGVLPVEGWR